MYIWTSSEMRYVGEFVNGKREGNGEIYLESDLENPVFVGEFKDDQKVS